VPDTIPPPPSGLPPAPLEPGATPFPRDRGTKGRGCLKWGLIGCAGISVIVIVGLLLLGSKAKSFLDSTLTKKGEEVVLRATPEVTAEEKTAFREAYRGFIDGAKEGRVPIGRMTSFTSKSDAALSDGSITPEEIRDLTDEVRQAPVSAPTAVP
jgi:hypothetical protein